ncbi:hypothetical protein RQP46_010309 [Phenoliferia psychrophenolica]
MMVQPATRPLHFLPEIISLIVAELAATFEEAISRNGALVRVALVDSTWAASALPFLYSNLHLEWRLSYVERFLAAVDLNPQVLLRVRRFDATRTTLGVLTTEAHDNDGLITEEDIAEHYHPSWQAFVDEQDPALGLPARDYEDWVSEERWEDATRAALGHPDGVWADDNESEVTEGDVAVWGLISRLASLKHLRLRGFSGAADKPDLTRDAEPVLARLESLDVQDESEGFLSAALARVTTDVRHWTMDASSLRTIPLLPTLHFPSLRHLTVTHWSTLDDEVSGRTGSYTVLSLALACRNTLETLEFAFQDHLNGRREYSGADLITIAGTLPDLKVLRNLSLSPATRWPERRLESHDDVKYPPQFLDALSLTTLHSFAINEPPTSALLAALPPTTQLLTFNPEIPTFEPGGRSRLSTTPSLDRALTLLIAAKDDLRLPLLRHVTLKRPAMRNWNFDFLVDDDATEETVEEKRVKTEEEYLRREQRAHAAGFGLSARPWLGEHTLPSKEYQSL